MKKRLSIAQLILFLIASPVFFMPPAARACTLWGVTGDAVAGGGTLIARNVDYHPSYTTKLEFVQPGNGYRYLADVLYGAGISRGVQCGVNAKGLVVTSATAQIKKSMMKPGEKTGFNECVLRNYHSVDSFLADRGMVRAYAAGFHMVADSEKMVMVEIAPGGQDTIQVVDRGPLYHTNEYCAPGFLKYNQAPGRSSRVRYNRIRDLMTTHAGFFTLDHFIAISQDQHDGPNDSLWRIGMTAGSERTLATWIVHLPAAGSPVMYLKTANAGEDMKSMKRTLRHGFWKNQRAGVLPL